MHLNTKLMKAQYREKAGSKRVGFKTKTVQKSGMHIEKVKRTDWLAKLLGLFKVKLFTSKTVEERWMEKQIQPRMKRGGSKLGLRLFKTQVRAIAKVQRKQALGQRVSMTDIMRTGMPVRLRDLREYHDSKTGKLVRAGAAS